MQIMPPRGAHTSPHSTPYILRVWKKIVKPPKFAVGGGRWWYRRRLQSSGWGWGWCGLRWKRCKEFKVSKEEKQWGSAWGARRKGGKRPGNDAGENRLSRNCRVNVNSEWTWLWVQYLYVNTYTIGAHGKSLSGWCIISFSMCCTEGGRWRLHSNTHYPTRCLQCVEKYTITAWTWIMFLWWICCEEFFCLFSPPKTWIYVHFHHFLLHDRYPYILNSTCSVIDFSHLLCFEGWRRHLLRKSINLEPELTYSGCDPCCLISLS